MTRHEPDAASLGHTVKIGPRILEAGVPLSQSVIWRLQQDFYARRGLKAWTEDMVPSYITNNPFIAEIYAQIVAGFLADCMQQAQPPSPENPLRILELGAGTGKFSFLFLRKLNVLLRDKKMPPRLFRYCMEDCSESLIAEWRANPYLAEFVNAGVLEFKLTGREEEQPSQAAQPKAPLVVIANYVFDSLPQDAFIIAGGQISEALVTTTGESESAGPQPLNSLQRSFKNVPVAAGRYAAKPWNEILEHYRKSLAAATVLFPSTALHLLEHLGQSSDGRMLVLAADKGFTREDELIFSQGPPSMEFHAAGHCFSQQVNFDALARYFWSMGGGEAFLPQKHFSSLSICAFLQHNPDETFPATRKAYELSAAGFGPDDLFALMNWLNAHLEEVSIVQALALLRLTHWDTTAFLRLFPVIARQLRSVTAGRHDLRQAVFNVWANHYPISPSETTLAFSCGAILLELNFFADALAMFKTSQQVLGQSASTSFNMGLCAIGLDCPAEALNYMIDACNLDPSFQPARNSRMKLEQQLASTGTE